MVLDPSPPPLLSVVHIDYQWCKSSSSTEKEKERNRERERARAVKNQRKTDSGLSTVNERERRRESEREREREKKERTNGRTKKKKKEGKAGGEKTGLPGSNPSSSTRYAPSRKAQFVSTSYNAHIEYTHTNRVKIGSEYQVCAEDEGAVREHLLQCAHRIHTYNHRGSLL